MAAKILVVEDERLMAEMYRDRFSQKGYQVFWARDSEEAFELAKKEKPDLILLDILLPTDNGIALLKRIREDPSISKLKVIAFSNYDEIRTKKEAFKLGVEDYLIKTQYTPNQLLDKVKQYLS
jgi:two-component system alkaline phosphatase synthesis response regulator PhoP